MAEHFLSQILKFRNATDPVQLETIAVLDALTLSIQAQLSSSDVRPGDGSASDTRQLNDTSSNAANSNTPAPIYYFAAIVTSLSERKQQNQPITVTRSLLFILTLV
jgi:hypothetical protein